MDLGDALNSINKTKQNLVRDENMKLKKNEKIPSFVIQRSLSYHLDAVQFVALLNQYDSVLSDAMKYEFLLNILTKKNRFAKWGKIKKSEILDKIMKYENVSIETAKSYLRNLTEEEQQQLLNLEGGK